jgi:hypothetical protein
MPLQRLLAALHSAPPPPAPPGAGVSAQRFSRAALLRAFETNRDLPALMARSHPHLSLQERAGFGRCTFAARALPAGATVLREAAFASVRLSEATRGCDGALVDTLRVHVGDGSAAAALPYYAQQEPNLEALAAGHATPSTSALAFMAPAIHRNSFVGGGLLLSVLLASLTNHSCDPNVAARLLVPSGGEEGAAVAASAAAAAAATPAPEIVFTALRPIAAGEELSVSYIDSTRSFAERRERLAATYAFHCTCARCRAEALLDPSPCPCAACAAEVLSSAAF